MQQSPISVQVTQREPGGTVTIAVTQTHAHSGRAIRSYTHRFRADDLSLDDNALVAIIGNSIAVALIQSGVPIPF